MNQKYDITKIVLESVGIEASHKRVRQTIPTWWFSTRQKEKGGLRLTDQGFEALLKADIKSYELKIDEEIQFTNELIIWIDQNLDCPYYLTKRKIWVFGEKTAVELVLFSGNIAKLFRAKKRFQEKTS